MNTVAPERCFTIAAFLAFTELLAFRADNPNVPLKDSIPVLKKFKSSASTCDFKGITQLTAILDEELAWDNTKSGLRLFISELIRYFKPQWMQLIPYGRDKLRTVLSVNVIQCFREAGLFETPPDEDVVAWWDNVSAFVRGVVDTERMIRARNAERLSLEYERKRLTGLGIERDPEWVSIEDNMLGYDIRSYDRSGDHIVGRLVEVKSTLSDTIFISRNEWDNAITSADQVVFHVWKFPSQELHEYPTAVMQAHIPSDQGGGVWKELKVTLGF